jgi:hypothetical protein
MRLDLLSLKESYEANLQSLQDNFGHQLQAQKAELLQKQTLISQKYTNQFM